MGSPSNVAIRRLSNNVIVLHGPAGALTLSGACTTVSATGWGAPYKRHLWLMTPTRPRAKVLTPGGRCVAHMASLAASCFRQASNRAIGEATDAGGWQFRYSEFEIATVNSWFDATLFRPIWNQAEAKCAVADAMPIRAGVSRPSV